MLTKAELKDLELKFKDSLMYLSKKLKKDPREIIQTDLYHEDVPIHPTAIRKHPLKFTGLRDKFFGKLEKPVHSAELTPNILVFDLETSPSKGYFFDRYNTNIRQDQIIQNSYLLSFAAKWLHDHPKKLIQMDAEGSKDFSKDTKMVEALAKLLDKADLVLTHNGNRFDIPFINYRIIENGLLPPTSYKKIDTYRIAKKYFKFPSNSLDYLTTTLNTKYFKQKSKEFRGFELWRQCLENNPKAWKHMRTYNIHDILALEELYGNLRKWDHTINYNVYHNKNLHVCSSCGADTFRESGFHYTPTGKYQKFACTDCNFEFRSATNLFDKAKRATLSRTVVR